MANARIERYLKKANKDFDQSKQFLELVQLIKTLCEKWEKEDLGEYPEAAIRAYVITGSTKEAANLLTKKGYRNNTRNYNGQDITAAILDDSEKVRSIEGIEDIKMYFTYGKERTDKKYN